MTRTLITKPDPVHGGILADFGDGFQGIPCSHDCENYACAWSDPEPTAETPEGYRRKLVRRPVCAVHAPEPEIFTNHRGFITLLPGQPPLDGERDGFSWQAWSGRHIGYGATKQDAIGAVRTKLGRNV